MTNGSEFLDYIQASDAVSIFETEETNKSPYIKEKREMNSFFPSLDFVRWS